MGWQGVFYFDVWRETQVILAMTPRLELVWRNSHRFSWRSLFLKSGHLVG